LGLLWLMQVSVSTSQAWRPRGAQCHPVVSAHPTYQVVAPAAVDLRLRHHLQSKQCCDPVLGVSCGYAVNHALMGSDGDKQHLAASAAVRRCCMERQVAQTVPLQQCFGAPASAASRRAARVQAQLSFIISPLVEGRSAMNAARNAVARKVPSSCLLSSHSHAGCDMSASVCFLPLLASQQPQVLP
jgi:hypothetical protein